MRSLNFGNIYRTHKGYSSGVNKKEVSAHMWVCINCWEVLLGHETKMEHINARHLLTSSLAESEPIATGSYNKLCRIYGKINPEETHVVLFYIPQYVREGVRNNSFELKHVTEQRKRRE